MSIGNQITLKYSQNNMVKIMKIIRNYDIKNN